MGVYSQKLINKCKTHGLNIEEYIFCSLLDYGISKSDAYIIVYKPTTGQITKINNEVAKLLKEEGVKLYLTYLSKLKDQAENESIKAETKIRKQIEAEYLQRYEMKSEVDKVNGTEQTQQYKPKNRTKEDIINELNQLLEIETDPKLKLDYYKQLADLQGMKKEQDKEDENTIHYYFPITCKDCKNLERE